MVRLNQQRGDNYRQTKLTQKNKNWLKVSESLNVRQHMNGG